MKKRKNKIWVGAFVVLILLNALIMFRFIGHTRRVQQVQTLLAEIGQELPAVILPPGGFRKGYKTADNRVANLKAFLRKYNSPLYDHADTIVEVSDKYEFDYRLLPAIAMQESGLCRVIPPESHNCWGWGIYGNTVTRFASYPEALDTVGRGLRKNYLDKGLVTATQIMEKYTPSSNGSWARAVNNFIEAIGY